VDLNALEGMAVTSVNNSHGYWQYTINGGSSWMDFNSPSAAAARLLAADENTRVRFVPDQSWNGILNPGIRFQAWDRSSGANGETLDIHDDAVQTAFSLADAKADISIRGNNDLSLKMDAPAGPVLAGTSLTYSLTIANAGPANATNVTVTDTLPEGVSFETGSSQCRDLNGTVTCNIDILEAGSSLNLTIKVTIGTSVIGALNNVASVTAAETDEDQSNNTAQTGVKVVPAVEVYSLGNTPGSEWNRPVTTLSPNRTQLMGEFGNETVSLKLDNLPFHTQAIVSFDLYILRSWDGNQVNWPGNIASFPGMAINAIIGPDHWRLDADGKNLLDTTFSNWAGQDFHQAYPENYPEGSHPAQTGAVRLNSLGYATAYGPLDATYHMSYTVDHQNSSLVVDFTGSGLQELSDESWDLGNVRVDLTAGADPTPYKTFFPIIGR
jgi:uncharacterized repeat protein (TIGR01451 family)